MAEPLTLQKRVLCVDDDAINRLVIKHILLSLNLSVDLASDGKAALDLIKQKNSHYNLVLLDILMPEMDGFKTAAAIREIAPANALPIVFVSAGIFEDIDEKMNTLDVQKFLGKPVDKESLQKVIDQLS